MTDPLVFLPGMMCDARLFASQLIGLSRDTAVTVAPITQGETIEEIATGLLEVLPPKFALTGLSMGGIVAMEILRRAPERVSRIALMDTNALAETPQSATMYEPFISKARSGQLDEAMRDFMKPDFLAPGPGRLAVLNTVFDMARDMGPEVFVRQVRALQRRHDQQPTLRKCKCPALVLCGEVDALTPVKRHRFMADLIPCAELEIIPGAGHLPVLEQPEAVTAALRRWLARSAAQRA